MTVVVNPQTSKWWWTWCCWGMSLVTRHLLYYTILYYSTNIELYCIILYYTVLYCISPRSLAPSIARPLARSLARPLPRSPPPSLARSPPRSLDRSPPRSLLDASGGRQAQPRSPAPNVQTGLRGGHAPQRGGWGATPSFRYGFNAADWRIEIKRTASTNPCNK